MDKHIEIRKLPAAVLNPVIDILDINKDWQKLMIRLPKDLKSEIHEPKYNQEHMELIEDHAQATRSKCAKVLFDEWGSSGETRPTLHILRDILIKEKMFRAADKVSDIINEPYAQRPNEGPAAEVDTSITSLLTTKNVSQHSTLPMQSEEDMESSGQYAKFAVPNLKMLNPQSDKMVGDRSYRDLHHQIDTDILEDTNLIQFDYKELQFFTKNFTATHIGSGGFGNVYVCRHPTYGQLAIKQAHNQQSMNNKVDFIKIFNREVRSLSFLRHKNIVPILGFSSSGQEPCIVCKYIEGGSLTQKIAEKVLNETQRINIMIGVAEGLKYIHSSAMSTTDSSDEKFYFMHGDVKSANILLTVDLEPKLCDFGLAKQYSETFHTVSIMGTSPYMSPETLQGTVTQKSDIYSYGIVLLELLTGLKSIVKTYTGEVILKDFVKSKCADGNITSILDPLIAGWVKANDIYQLTKLCLNRKSEARPSMEKIYIILNELK